MRTKCKSILTFSHVECGTLHCQGGSASPLLPSQSTYSSHSRKVNGAEVQCKVTSMNGNGGGNGGAGSMGGMGQAGNLNGAINIGPGGGVGGMMGMGMGGMDPRRPLGDLGMVQDGTRCGDNMVNERNSELNIEVSSCCRSILILILDLHESDLHRFTPAEELCSVPFGLAK